MVAYDYIHYTATSSRCEILHFFALAALEAPRTAPVTSMEYLQTLGSRILFSDDLVYLNSSVFL